METIGVVVKSLNNLEVLDILLVELGSRHFTYGTKANHFVVCISISIIHFINSIIIIVFFYVRMFYANLKF